MANYGASLAETVAAEISGDYEKVMLKIIA
jgi:hypothetical protein